MTTKLEAINTMLSCVGQSPLETLEGTKSYYTISAEQILDKECKRVLLEGWDFNTDEQYELKPDVNKTINITDDMLLVQFPQFYKNRFVTRKNKLYDKLTQSFKIQEPIRVKIVWNFKFEDVPENFKIKFENRTTMNDIDEIFNDLYNTGNEVQNEAKIYSSQYERGSRNTLSGKGETSNQLPTESAENINGDKSSGINNRAREFSSTSNNLSEQTLRNTNNSNQQFNTIKSRDTRPTEQQLNERAKSIKSEEEANALLDEAAQNNKEVIPWKITLENAEDYYQQLTAKGLDTTAIREAISNNDVEAANMIAAKQTAAERLIKDIADELTKTSDEARFAELYEAMTHLANISKKLSSASGRALNAQKVVNKARKFFSLTSLEEEGLQSLADLLSVDIKSLNFTRNVSDLKKELYQKISKYNDGIFFDELVNDTSTLEEFDKWLMQYNAVLILAIQNIRKQGKWTSIMMKRQIQQT